MTWDAVLVPERALDRLARSCDVPFALCPADAALPDGAVVSLMSRRVGALGLAITDRTAECWRLVARADEHVDALDDAYVDRRLDVALRLRHAHGLAKTGTAYRLVNAAGDSLPGLVVDCYGDYAVVSALTPAMLTLASHAAHRMVARGQSRGVVIKRRERGGAADGPSIVEMVGEAPPERLVVAEGPWQFEVHLATGVNVGLFTDMRLERPRIASLSRERRVLNLFAYTGALSVAAASGGATDVTSVDVSTGVLAWARDHFELNRLPAERHRVVAEDAVRFVTQAIAAGDMYDFVLIDPPSYSSARHASFAVDQDYPPLVQDVCRLLAPGGDLWLASNTRGFSLLGTAQLALGRAGRSAHVVALGGLPPDYPTELADADARYLQTCLLRVS